MQHTWALTGVPALNGQVPGRFAPFAAGALLATCVSVAGCAGTNSTMPMAEALSPEPAKSTSRNVQTAAANEYDCTKPDKCLARLKAMTKDPQRSWIRQPEPPATFATGVRLFAYAALQKKLTCDELALALLEIDSARKTFGGSVAGVSPEQVVAVRALTARVGQELRVENAARCARLTSAG